MSQQLTFEARLAALEEEAARLGSVVASELEAPVPSCPGWKGRQLAEHVAGVLTFWAHQLAAADPSRRHQPPEYEPSPDPVAWLDAASGVLVEALAELGPPSPCWNWSGDDLRSGWVARRTALEVAVHRYDGELSAADPTPLPPGLAVDGIDERLEVFLRQDIKEAPDACLGGPLCLSCDDVTASWVVEAAHGRLRVREGAGPAAAVLRGSASQLFLFTWNRVSPEALELTGERAVAEAWGKLPVG